RCLGLLAQRGGCTPQAERAGRLPLGRGQECETYQHKRDTCQPADLLIDSQAATEIAIGRREVPLRNRRMRRVRQRDRQALSIMAPFESCQAESRKFPSTGVVPSIVSYRAKLNVALRDERRIADLGPE